MKYITFIKEKYYIYKDTLIGLIFNYFIPFTTPFGCFILLEYMWRTQKDGSFSGHPLDDMTKNIVSLNILIFYMIAIILLSIMSSSRIASIVMIAITYILGLANYFVIMFRSSPIVPSDIYSIGTAAKVSNNYEFTICGTITLLTLAAIVGIILNILFGFRLPHFKKKYFTLLIHFVPLLVCLIGFNIFGSYISSEDVQEKIENFNDTLFLPSSMYSKDGYALATLYSLQFIKIEKPEGYSDEAVAELEDKYSDDSIWSNATISKTDSESAVVTIPSEKANIVVIMNECFSDPKVLGEFTTNIDYMPLTHSMLNGNTPDTISGYLYASVLGGNTANTEFEFLTGDSMAFMPAGSVPYQQYINNTTKSMASVLDSQDYATVAAHPYVSTGWKRNKVYPLLGFKASYFAMHMSDLNVLRLYNDDQSFYNWLTNNVFTIPRNYFSFNVTMQNHASYGGVYDNFQSSVTIDGVQNRYLENYLTLMKISDDAFRDLINHFRQVSKPTIVVMFGDHQPDDYVVSDIYRINGKDINKISEEEYYERYKVPVIIWANYDIPEVSNLQISANYLGGIITKLAGCETSPYQNFLESLREDVPVITSRGFLDENGKYHSIDEIEDYCDKISDYKILQYNNIFN